MPSLKPDQLNSLIDSKKIGSLYLFDGPENWLKEKAVDRIIKLLVPPEAKDFNLERLDGATCTAGAIINAAASLPWMAERRVVIVNQTEELSSAESKAVGETLAHLPDSTCLIFLYEGRASLREEIAAQAGSRGAIVTFWTPFPNQWPALVMSEARARGKTITADAAQMLSDVCEDLQQMAMELDKLSLFVGDKKSIDRDDLRRHGLPDQTGDYDELEEALWSRNTAEALRQAHQMLDAGVQPVALLAVFERIFRNLILGRYEKVALKADWEAVFNRLGMRSRTAQGHLQKGLQSYSEEELNRSLEAVTQADFETKTGTLPGPVAITFLILKLCGGSRERVTSRF